MYPRQNYEMTQEDCDMLLDNMKSVPMIMLNVGGGRSQQDRANDAWKALGAKMGFEWDSPRPIDGKGMRFFSAIPSENEQQRSERISRDAEDKKRSDIQRIEQEIAALQAKLAEILT